MIDTRRLGALLRSLIRDDALVARLRTPATAPIRPVALAARELARPLQESTESLRNGASGALRAVGDVVHGGSTTVPSTVPPRSAALEFSEAGRLLLAAVRSEATVAAPMRVPGSAMQPVSGAVAGGARGTPAQAVQSRSPLISVPPHSEVATDRLALQLKDAVEFSGVFYEAHLAQWADDVRPRALLSHEPQSRWPVATAIATEVTGNEATTAEYATPLLRQQLEVLDTGRFVWRGELWPGQPGTLIIEEEEPPPQRGGLLDAPPVPRWRMHLTLDFARLGAIDAAVALAGESVDFNLRCAHAGAAQELRGAAATLRVAIAERALDVATLGISDDRAA